MMEPQHRLIFIRLVKDLGDLPTFLSCELTANPNRIIGIFVFLYYIPAVVALRYLWKQMVTSTDEEPDS